MEVISQRNQTRPYPKYLYHPDFNEPKIVNSQVEEAELGTKGWVTTYLFKAYPKYVGDKIVKSKEEEEQLLAESNSGEEVASPDEMFDGGSGVVIPESFDVTPPVTKEIQVNGVDPTVVEKPKRGRPPKK